MHIKTILLGTVAAAAISLGAIAAPISGTININGPSVSNVPGGVINDGQTFTIAGATFNAGTGDYALIPNGTPLTIAPFTSADGQAFTFTSAVGSFAGTINDTEFLTTLAQRSLTLFITGTFTPAGVLSGFDPNPQTTITYNINQTGPQKNSSATVFDTPPAVPAPMSLALFGMGLAGLGMAMRRRKV